MLRNMFCKCTVYMGGHTPSLICENLRCIKDWISTVLALTQVAYNISRKGNDMDMWCDIQSHPTRPKPTHFNAFAPTKHTKRVVDLFSLFFVDSSIIALNRYIGQSMSKYARASQKRHNLSPKIHTCTNDFVFLLYIIVQAILRTTVHSMCCSSFVSLVLTCSYNISGKKNSMGFWCDIYNRPHPLPHPKPCPHVVLPFVVAMCAYNFGGCC